jgi:hypothetical protein
MDDENKVTPDLEEMSDESRRNFLNKLLAGVGGVAAAGLLASALGSPAEAAPMANEGGHLGSLSPISGTPLRYQALENGHSLSASSRGLAQTLAREGLINSSKIPNGALASVSLSLSYG